ncbi:MAG: type IV toxin-antitoxin system AbiEi family antitoxin domain-containing protein, partial [Solirubrobacteraceae bacterium]
MTHGRDGAVARIAGGRRTLVTPEQLAESGVSRRVIAHWVNRGRLRIVFRGVYSVVDGELPALALEQAALIACGEGAFLS